MDVDMEEVKNNSPPKAQQAPTTPTDNKYENLDSSLDSENVADTSTSSISTEKALSAHKVKATPEAVRTRRQIQEQLHMNSPSDSMLSPCTSKLFGKGGKKAVSGPAAALRKKQTTSIPFNLGD